MSIHLPEPVANYFRYKADENLTEAAGTFTPAAMVFDKGEDREVFGREAIHRWFIEQAATVKTTVDVVSSREENGEFVVTTLVSGNFKGSPAEFEYRFTLRDGSIDRLVIEFRGFK
jgi:hypothetical protein